MKLKKLLNVTSCHNVVSIQTQKYGKNVAYEFFYGKAGNFLSDCADKQILKMEVLNFYAGDKEIIIICRDER